ncbi:TfoX/Sxy family protein [Saccharicrinis aurantiacus]|uniref:TfoX/Sxy family protein n=1 Tax=Saccharicrinis aurantiacus TaxID=1849719 RepID=UPI002492E773|nr:TfoX/Sxy family protein [Saccharicrinis aurantiacus]
MAISNDFLQFILDQLYLWEGVSAKHMFGGAALYKNELAFGMIADNQLYFKVDQLNIEKYIKADSIQLKPFKNHKTVLSFYSVPVDVIEDASTLVEWAKESYQIQLDRNNNKIRMK